MCIFKEVAKHNQIGKEGEARSCAYLKEKGYTILHTNWRWHHFELDIVATNGKELVVVEVKTRSEDYLVAPEEAVNRGKIRRIILASDAYVRKYNLSLPVRFDIITLVKKEDRIELDHLEDAFYPAGR